MRILMLDNEFPPLGGGTGVVNYHLLEELAVYQEVWVDLVTSSRTRDCYETEQFSDRIMIHKVPVDNHNIHHSTNRELLRYSRRGLWFSHKLLKQHQYDLSFAFAGVPAGAISYMLRLRHGLPYQVSLQGPDVPGFEARFNYLYPVLKPILRRIWGNAAVVTAISQDHQRLAHQTMPHLHIPIVFNGVDTRVFKPFAQPQSGDEINILSVGRLIERKGQHFLLEAFARLRQRSNHRLHLTLAGTGDAEPTLHHLAAKLGLTDAVTFTGFVTREDMPQIYQQADIFALPSQNEGMSIALLEAMATGLPVVVTDTGGTAELVKEGVNGYIVEWADINGLVEALKTMTEDKLLRSNMGQNSLKFAKEFSWPCITQEYLRLWDEIITASSGVKKAQVEQ